jgi:hypothetical protein
MPFAYVIHEPVRDPARFGETVTVNRGMKVKTFNDTKSRKRLAQQRGMSTP